MNKTYRSIWNEALGAWVATSELQSGRGKTARSKRAIRKAAIGLAVGALMPLSVFAQAAGSGVVNPGTNGTAASDFGCAAPATVSGLQGIAVGCGATASTANSIAVGASSAVVNVNDVSIGAMAGNGSTPLTANAEPNVFVGASAGAASSQGGGVAMGLRAGQGIVGYGNLMFGYQAGLGTAGSDNVGVGRDVASGIQGSVNTAIGAFTMQSISGDFNTAIGSRAGQNYTGTALGTYSANTAIGFRAGQNMRAGVNTAIGANAGREIQGTAHGITYADGTSTYEDGTPISGTFNTAVGADAGAQVNGTDNSALGTSAGIKVVGSGNVAVGLRAGQSVTASNTIGIGTDALATTNGAMAIGQEAGATGTNAIAMGVKAAAGINGMGATGVLGGGIAIGSEAKALSASRGSTIAIGSRSVASSPTGLGDSLAVGTDARATGQDSLAVGAQTEASGTFSTAVGQDLTKATGLRSSAFGAEAQATADRSLALGGSAQATHTDAVALGFGSTTAPVVNTAGTTIRGTPYAFAGTDAASTVSVGSGAAVNGVRTITNVAAGRISATSTDAINGSQLYATNSAIEDLSVTVAANKTKYYSVKSTGGTNEDNLGATGIDGIAAGKNAVTSAAAGVAMGLGATASGAGNAVAVGSGAMASAQNALALGAGSTASAENTIAMGLGSQSTAAQGTAIGNGAQALTASSVALGSGSVSDRAVVPTQGQIPVVLTPEGGSISVPYNTTDKTLLGAVSVGNATGYRQIINVADGTASSDAVTVRQLTGALSAFSTTPTKYFHANSAAMDSVAAGAESIAVGPQTVVNGDNGVGIGNGAIVQQTAPGGIAIGQAATSHLADSIAVGTGASAAAVQGVAVGRGSSVTQVGGVALGAGSVASTAAGVAGYIPPTATAEQRTAIGATTSTLSAVSVGDAANGQFRQITGVAAGSVDSDAVNVSQLKGVQAQVTQIDQGSVKYDTNVDGSINYNSVTMGGNNSTGPVSIHNVAPGVAGTDAVNVNQLTAVNNNLNSRIDSVNNRIDGVAKNAYAGVASAMALQMPASYVPGKTVMRIGVGAFKGQGAVGISFRRTSDNNAWSLSGGVATSRAGVGATIGAEWVFN